MLDLDTVVELTTIVSCHGLTCLHQVSIKFDKPFYGIIFSKGFYSDVNCVHLPAGVGRSEAQFDVAINSCGTTGNTGNGDTV